MRYLFIIISLVLIAAKKPEKIYKDLYGFAYIPEGKVTLNLYTDSSYLHSVSAFLISKTELTNAEYRKFLGSIKNDFDRQAMHPDTSVWAQRPQKPGQLYLGHYFSHPSFDQYPVVGLNREQIDSYCTWLTDSLSSKFPNLKLKARLPSKFEWIRAAQG